MFRGSHIDGNVCYRNSFSVIYYVHHDRIKVGRNLLTRFGSESKNERLPRQKDNIILFSRSILRLLSTNNIINMMHII